jgi:cytochrome c
MSFRDARWTVALSMTLFLTVAHGQSLAGSAARGKELYESRCTACHSLDRSRIGPAHRGVFGRRAGQVVGYDYSEALRNARVTWTAHSLDRWLTDPEAFLPGQKMGYSVADARDRADIIAFLASPEASCAPRERAVSEIARE